MVSEVNCSIVAPPSVWWLRDLLHQFGAHRISGIDVVYPVSRLRDVARASVPPPLSCQTLPVLGKKSPFDRQLAM